MSARLATDTAAEIFEQLQNLHDATAQMLEAYKANPDDQLLAQLVEIRDNVNRATQVGA